MAPDAVPYVLSGPSFAVDVAAGRPTAVTLAGDDAAATEAIAAALAGPSFRPYAAGDRVGVELAGALKNVYALAAGAVEGAGLGASARAALIARAFAELGRHRRGAGRAGGDADRARRARRSHAQLHLGAVAQLPARRGAGARRSAAGRPRRGRVHRAGGAAAGAQGGGRRAADRCGQSAARGNHVDRPTSWRG